MARWFYTCGGLILGPVTVPELREAVRKKVLGPLDLVWPEDGGRGLATTLAAALKLKPGTYELPPPAVAPDWVGDVEQTAPEPPPSPAAAPLPDWLSDVGQEAEPAGPAVGPLPDWLSDMQATLPSEPEPPPPAEEPVTEAPPEEPPADPVPLARRVAPKVVPNRHDEPTLPDPDRPKTPDEVYDAAALALRRWVDAPGNRRLVSSGDLEAICRTPILRQFFAGVEKHSPEMAGRLRLQLQFLVDNRRRFFNLS